MKDQAKREVETIDEVPGTRISDATRRKEFFAAMAMSLIYGLVGLVLALAIWVALGSGFLAGVLSTTIAVSSPIAVWVMAIRIDFEAPETPGRKAGAKSGAALFTGIWLLLIPSICGRM